jgi:hypothetical protein
MSAGLIFVFFLLGRWKRDKTHIQIVALIEYPQMRSIIFSFWTAEVEGKNALHCIATAANMTLKALSMDLAPRTKFI